MPVVSTRTEWVHGKDFKVRLNYSPKRKIFYIKLPSYVAATLGIEQVEASAINQDPNIKEYDPQRAVERKFEAAIKDYDKLVETKKKVIFYTFQSRVRKQGIFPGHSDSYGPGEVSSYGVAMDLWFNVGMIMQHPVRESVQYFDLSGKKVGDSGWKDWKWMEWTAEREAFFSSFREYLENGIVQMREFFNKADATIAQLIDKGMTPALPAPIKPKTVEATVES